MAKHGREQSHKGPLAALDIVYSRRNEHQISQLAARVARLQHAPRGVADFFSNDQVECDYA